MEIPPWPILVINAEHAAAPSGTRGGIRSEARRNTRPRPRDVCEECAKSHGHGRSGKGWRRSDKTCAVARDRTLIPSDVPSVRKILRPGQPDYSEGNPAANLPDIFQKLTVLDENEV